MRQWLPATLRWPLLATGVLLAQAFWLYGHTGRDDAFFTYWAAQALADNGSITNYNGERVEQSSTLLLTLLLAGLHALLPTVALPTLAWACSLAAGAATLWLTATVLHRAGRHPALVLPLALAPALVFWTSSGMETVLSAALFTAILALCLHPARSRRDTLWLLLACALAVLCRPETFLVLGCAAAVGLILCPRLARAWLLVLLATAITAGAVTLWRLYYFGDAFPQPVSAKHVPVSPAVILKGLYYLWQAGELHSTRCLLAAGFASGLLALLFWRHPQRAAVLACALLAGAQAGFAVTSGGDWMDATRFLVPVVPALWLCGALVLPANRLTLAALLALALPVATESWHFARTASTGLAVTDHAAAHAAYLPAGTDLSAYSDTELQTKDALRDIPQLEHLHGLVEQLSAHGQPLAIASIQMGFIPYHLAQRWPDRLHLLDLRGLAGHELTDCWVLRHVPRSDTGIRISYDEFFALLPNLERLCGVKRPDILYDLGYAMRADVLAEQGYVITYMETRHVRGNFSARGIGSELFVAVRRDLAAQYGLRDHEGKVVTAPAAAAAAPPNIVLVLADDISYHHFGFMGSAAAQTPTLDALARQGTTFTTGYVPVAFCRPTLATLLTGQWPHQTRLHANHGVRALPPGSVTLATRLQQAGYATFSGGKFWEDEPETRGFDAFDTEKERFAREGQQRLWQFIREQGGQRPLFIWWAPLLPHTPHNPPPSLVEAIDPDAIAIPPTIPPDQVGRFREQERTLLAMNLWFDREVAQLRDHLAAQGLLDNTLFVFLSDNGYSYGAVSKSSPYEAGIRTPVVFHWPGHVPVQRIDTPLSVIHLFNTVLDYAGLPPASTAPLSHSVRPVIEQQSALAAETQFGAAYPSYTLKTDPDPRPERDIYALHLRDGDWKYILYLRDLREADNYDLTIRSGVVPFPKRDAGDEELYDLTGDPHETQNLAGEPGREQQLGHYRQQVLDWWTRTGGKPLDALAQCPAQPVALCRKVGALTTP